MNAFGIAHPQIMFQFLGITIVLRMKLRCCDFKSNCASVGFFHGLLQLLVSLFFWLTHLIMFFFPHGNEES